MPRPCANRPNTMWRAMRGSRPDARTPRAAPRWRLFLLLGCGAVLVLSFWLTLALLDQWEPKSWRQFQVTLPVGAAQTRLDELPLLPDTRLSWVGIGGINAQIVAGLPSVVSGLPVLRLMAVQGGLHAVTALVAGLIKNETYRITAWIRPLSGANFAIEARDQAGKAAGSNNGHVIFDLANQKVLSATGNGKPGIREVGDWLTVWLDLPTSDGQYVVNFYVCDGKGAEAYAADGRLGMLFAGLSAD